MTEDFSVGVYYRKHGCVFEAVHGVSFVSLRVAKCNPRKMLLLLTQAPLCLVCGVS
mgnify:CR=1 FL=1